MSPCALCEPIVGSVPSAPVRAAGLPARRDATSTWASVTTVAQPVPVTETPSGRVPGVGVGAEPAIADLSGSGTTTSLTVAPAGAEKVSTAASGVANRTSVKPSSRAGALVSCVLHACTRSGVEVTASIATTIRATSVFSLRGVTTSWYASRPATVVCGSRVTTDVVSACARAARAASSGVGMALAAVDADVARRSLESLS